MKESDTCTYNDSTWQKILSVPWVAHSIPQKQREERVWVDLRNKGGLNGKLKDLVRT